MVMESKADRVFLGGIPRTEGKLTTCPPFYKSKLTVVKAKVKKARQAGVMALRLRTLTAFPQDLGSIPNTHCLLTAVWTLIPGSPAPSQRHNASKTLIFIKINKKFKR